MLSGRLPVDISYGEEQCSLVRWAQKCCKERKFEKMVDLKIRGTMLPKCLRQFAQIADRCLLSVPKQRPTMTEVVASLHAVLRLQDKHDNSVDLGTTGFTWRLHKYLVSTSEQNSDQGGTSLPKSLENNRDGGDLVERPHQHAEVEATEIKFFTYDELRNATSNFGFDTCLAEGIYAAIYKGWVDNTTNLPCKHDTGLFVSITRLYSYELLDLEMLKEFGHHPNLVRLIGYCLFKEQLLLVHEFMLNGNFEEHLLSGAIAQLPLVTKVKIAVGIARCIHFLHVTQPDPYMYMREGTLGMYHLNRNEILFDEGQDINMQDFTVKLAGYDITMLVRGHYSQSSMDCNGLVHGDYYPGCEPVVLQSNLSGFKVIFAELVTGKQIFFESNSKKMDLFWRQRGGMSLSASAEKCFKICNEVDSELKMLKRMKKYEKYIHVPARPIGHTHS